MEMTQDEKILDRMNRYGESYEQAQSAQTQNKRRNVMTIRERVFFTTAIALLTAAFLAIIVKADRFPGEQQPPAVAQEEVQPYDPYTKFVTPILHPDDQVIIVPPIRPELQPYDPYEKFVAPLIHGQAQLEEPK